MNTKEEFIKYLEEHPDERFWQAVRNFSGYGFILASNNPNAILLDTFYWGGRNDMKGQDKRKEVKKPKKSNTVV